MPFLFEKIGDATELLLPEDLMTEHSIVADFRENLTDGDCGNEEVLGWFYQYYISEKKAEVMARNAAVPKQDDSGCHSTFHSTLDCPLPR